MSHRCPTCESTFETRRGLGVHHSRVHDERLPNRECKQCGTEFYSEYQKVYCSEECHDQGTSYEGAANPNYSGKRTKTECRLCGRQFEYYPSDKEGHYCPQCVETEPWQTLPDITGEHNPRWSGGKRETDCAVCGESVTRYRSEIADGVTVCSEECRRDWLSKSFSGDGHPNWKGGGNEAYGTGWNRIREKALERDGHACVICGKTSAEIGRNPDVHHIVPVRAFIESDHHQKEDAHTLDNVVSLCIQCHRKADFGKISKSRLRFLNTQRPDPA